MRKLCLLFVCALLASPAWAKSKELAEAVDLYESGQLSQARDLLRLLVDKRHFSEKDRVEARFYLAASDLALQDPDSAREQLKIVAENHPWARPDPAVFAPELVLLAQQIRNEVAQARVTGHGSHASSESQRRAEQKRVQAEKQQQLEAVRQAEKQQRLEAQPRAEQQAQLAAEPHPSGPIAEPTPRLTPQIAPSSPLEATRKAEVRGHPSRRTWGYVALGVAGAAAAVGAIFASGAKSSAEDAAKALTPNDYDKAKSDAESKSSISSASFIAAGLAAAGGGVLIGTSF